MPNFQDWRLCVPERQVIWFAERTNAIKAERHDFHRVLFRESNCRRCQLRSSVVDPVVLDRQFPLLRPGLFDINSAIFRQGRYAGSLIIEWSVFPIHLSSGHCHSDARHNEEDRHGYSTQDSVLSPLQYPVLERLLGGPPEFRAFNIYRQLLCRHFFPSH